MGTITRLALVLSILLLGFYPSDLLAKGGGMVVGMAVGVLAPRGMEDMADALMCMDTEGPLFRPTYGRCRAQIRRIIVAQRSIRIPALTRKG